MTAPDAFSADSFNYSVQSMLSYKLYTPGAAARFAKVTVDPPPSVARPLTTSSQRESAARADVPPKPAANAASKSAISQFDFARHQAQPTRWRNDAGVRDIGSIGADRVLAGWTIIRLRTGHVETSKGHQ